MKEYSNRLRPDGSRVARLIQVYAATSDLQPMTGTSKVYNDTGETLRILNARASVGTPPVGAAVIVDINLNDTTIFGSQAARPTITPGSVTNLTTGMTVVDWPTGAYLTVDIDQVGSTTPGADLTVQVTVA